MKNPFEHNRVMIAVFIYSWLVSHVLSKNKLILEIAMEIWSKYKRWTNIDLYE